MGITGEQSNFGKVLKGDGCLRAIILKAVLHW